ncbi:BIG GRAIN 1-like protein E [Tanacetum coccineum]
MPKTIIPHLQENKKPFHRRNGSGDLHVFEAARYYEATPHKNYMREGGRLSLDIPNNRRNSIPLHVMMSENRNSIPLQNIIMDHNPMMVKKEKKYKQPSSPGGKLAHFLNSLFNQASSKKSKSKSTTSTQSTKDEDESPSGWRRRRRSSISLFRSGNSNSNTVSETKPISSRTPPPYHIPQAPTKSATYKDHTRTCEITKAPFNENHNVKSGLYEKKSYVNGLLEKNRVCDHDIKQDGDHHQNKHDQPVEIQEFKRFILDDNDGGNSDSSSDLFELTNCDLGYYSSGLPVFETTHMDNIKKGAPISPKLKP